MPHSPLIEAKNVSFSYFKKMPFFQNLNLKINRGESLGLIGESGSGKSTLGKLLLRLLEPDFGQIFFEKEEITKLQKKALKPFRKKIQMIFQNPFSSLNPCMTVEKILQEPFAIFPLERKISAESLLEKVDLPKNYIHKFPRELSGGEKQRVSIARAIALFPDFIVCDEALSALDLNTQEEIIALLRDYQRLENVTYLVISHDISVLRRLVQRVCVMYFGMIVEEGTIQDLLTAPQHPYTKYLLASIPIPDPSIARKKPYIPLQGEPPSFFSEVVGCPFQSRCPFAKPICKEMKPKRTVVQKDHFVSCHLNQNETVCQHSPFSR